MRLKYATLVFLLVVISLAAWFLLRDPYPARSADPSKRSVCIRYEDGKYTLYRFGKPFLVKGGAGTTHLKELKAAGGNTLRTWDTTGLDSILADADRNQLAVIVGLIMPYNDDMDAFYNDDAKVDSQFAAYRQLVRKYRGSNAVLCWCLGNELTYPLKPRYFKFYKAFNRLVDMIHQEDPDHPVTTTLINFEQKYLINLKLWTHIDFISFNIFGDLRHLGRDLGRFRRWWNGPFLITEWGIDGPWTTHEHTAWNAFIEPGSDQKAAQTLELYQQHMPFKSPRFLGEMIFYWGNKQETTPTWFSLFDKHGNKSATVDVMQYLWTGHWPAQKAPGVNYMLVDNKSARDNLLYNPGDTIHARAFLKDTTLAGACHFEWSVQREDWFRSAHDYNQQALQSLNGLNISQAADRFVFRAPTQEGPYRVYANIYNDNGYFATCNTPFYVIGAQ
ncbi:hypothetical protein DCC81_19335 [Chitinophaga parva]|uniref:Glycoside hydrolase family 2 catalytic domain-containing protein n=1 Tax=Chitinophaga parva TaxID=2169414 RepID=A0A2T7BBW9_9BACT|nr:hypothetical protein [Chitinophaga parva]PUZ22591.1 hypothetical protein DCC81_19335 [Chitinophaga parva]